MCKPISYASTRARDPLSLLWLLCASQLDKQKRRVRKKKEAKIAKQCDAMQCLSLAFHSPQERARAPTCLLGGFFLLPRAPHARFLLEILLLSTIVARGKASNKGQGKRPIRSSESQQVMVESTCRPTEPSPRRNEQQQLDGVRRLGYVVVACCGCATLLLLLAMFEGPLFSETMANEDATPTEWSIEESEFYFSFFVGEEVDEQKYNLQQVHRQLGKLNPLKGTVESKHNPKIKAAGVPQKSKKKSKKDSSKEQEKKRAYGIAVNRLQNRIANKNITAYASLKDYPIKPMHPAESGRLLNSVRIPKAGSSTLSLIARALAACKPDGYPACGYPGSPKGSCPLKGLQCKQVTGQTDHHPDYSGDEPLITMLRHPEARLQSAFFYFPPHRPSPLRGNDWEVFEQSFIQSPRYQNVMTKMLSGSYAYVAYNPEIHKVSSAKERLCQTAWFAMNESPLLSALSLYEAAAFQQLIPNPVVFGLPPVEDTMTTVAVPTTTTTAAAGTETETSGLRVNTNDQYEIFREVIYPENNGSSLVHLHNQDDFEVYEFAYNLFCERLEAAPGLLEAAAQAGIASREMEYCQTRRRELSSSSSSSYATGAATSWCSSH